MLMCEMSTSGFGKLVTAEKTTKIDRHLPNIFSYDDFTALNIQN